MLSISMIRVESSFRFQIQGVISAQLIYMMYLSLSLISSVTITTLSVFKLYKSYPISLKQ